MQVRAALEASGLDYGPISVHNKMRAMGLDPVPSIASWSRIFRQAGVARLEPKKKPRSAWLRFVYPAPNACWQLDGTEYVLTGGRKCVILQLIDDHSPYAVASHVASGETAEAAIAVFDKAVTVHAVPQRLLSDTGLALNPSRRGIIGQLVAHIGDLGVEAITGKPYKPTTQVLVITDGDNITVTDLDGEILTEHTRPAPGVTYVGNGRPRGPRPKTRETSPKP